MEIEEDSRSTVAMPAACGTERCPREKNSWLLGKMSESGFPDASGREEG